MRTSLLDLAKRRAGLVSLVQPRPHAAGLDPGVPWPPLDREVVETATASPLAPEPPGGLAAGVQAAPVTRGSARGAVGAEIAGARPTPRPSRRTLASTPPPTTSAPDVAAPRHAEPGGRLPGSLPAAPSLSSPAAPRPEARVDESAPPPLPPPTSLDVVLASAVDAAESPVARRAAAPVDAGQGREVGPPARPSVPSSPVTPAPRTPAILAPRQDADAGEPRIEVHIGRIEIEPPPRPQIRRRAPRGFSAQAPARGHRDRRWY